MDLSKFSEATFNVKEWVNDILTPPSQLTSATDNNETELPSVPFAANEVETQAATVTMKLQLMVQELQKQLHESGLQLTNSIPRIVKEIDLLKLEASELKKEMKVVRNKVEVVHRETESSITRLRKIDIVKTKIETTMKELKQADNWTALTRDLDQLIYSQDPREISQRISEMNKCISLLTKEGKSNESDYERKLLVESLQNELEGSIAPNFIQAISSHNIQSCITFSQLLTQADRESSIIDFYVRTNREVLQQQWDISSESTVYKLGDYYASLLTIWQKELVWCTNVFPKPFQTICTLFIKSLRDISTHITNCLKDCLPDLSHNPLIDSTQIDSLVKVREVYTVFLNGVESNIVKINSDRNESLIDTSSLLLIKDFWLTVLYPLGTLNTTYNELLTLSLQQCLHELAAQIRTVANIETAIDRLKLQIVQLSKLVSKLCGECISITHGLMCRELVASLDHYLESIFNIWILKIQSFLSDTDSLLVEDCFGMLEVIGELILAIEEGKLDLINNLRFHLEPYFEEPGINIESLKWCSLDLTSKTNLNLKIFFTNCLLGSDDITQTDGLLAASFLNLDILRDAAGSLVFSSLSSKMVTSFETFHQLPLWNQTPESLMEFSQSLTGESPTFNPAPAGYITAIGDQLLTLPQVLEPFTSRDSKALQRSFSGLKIQYPHSDTAVSLVPTYMKMDSESEKDMTDHWIAMLSTCVQELFIQAIISLSSLSHLGDQQLCADIAYLCDILSALDLTPSPEMITLRKLFEMSPFELEHYIKSQEMPELFAQKITKIRLN